MQFPSCCLVSALILPSLGSPVLAADYSSDIRAAEHGAQAADAGAGIQQLLLPGSPMPKIGAKATQLDYVRWAENSLSRGQDAEAEVSLDWAVLRRRVDLIEAAYAAGDPPPPDDDLCAKPLCQALHAIGSGDAAAGLGFIRDARRAMEHQHDRVQTASR